MMLYRFSFIAVLVLSGLALTACSGTAAIKPEMPVSQAAAAREAPLPNVALTPEILYDVLLGEISGRRGQYGVSVRMLSRAAHATRDPRLAERATRAAIYAKRYQEALETGQFWVELKPKDREARESMAIVLLSLDKPAEAQLHFEKMLAIAESAGQLDSAYLRAASILGRHKNRSAAMEIMEILTRQHPRNPQAHFAVAHLAMRSGAFSRADRAIDQALLLQPGWEDAALLKGRILLSGKSKVSPEAFYSRFLRRYPKATSVRLNFARYLVDKKEWDKARIQFQKALKDGVEDRDALFALGLLSLQTDRLEDADAYLRRVIELNPHDDQVRLYLGQVAEQRKHYAEAARWYGAVSGAKYGFDAKARLGVVIARQGRLEEARKYLHGIKPEDQQQRVQLALAEEQVLREAKKYQEALKVLNHTIAAIPQNKDLLYARALVAEKLDDLELHEKDLRKVLEVDPKNAHALNALGYTLADRTDRYQEAHGLIKQALKLKPNDPFILDSMGWVQYRLGNTVEAIRYLRRALEVRDDAEISAHLGEVLWISGEREEAETVWERALKGTPDNESLLGIIKKFKP